MKWVCWEGVGVDRMACAWLIRKYIDPKAKFLFVPRGSQEIPEGAEPFDIPGVRLSHHHGCCTFHTMLDEYNLHDPTLRRIARIVDEADTVQEACIEAAAPGLDVICEGIRTTSPDDQTALERGALVYEALYAQLAAEMGPTAQNAGSGA
ncbi:MAG: chromate resistance protein ChrB domain-containing protein [Planctomycetaceae bacterium]